MPYDLNGNFYGTRQVRKGGTIKCIHHRFQNDALIPYEGQEVYIEEQDKRGIGGVLTVCPQRYGRFICYIHFTYKIDEYGIRRGVMPESGGGRK